MSILNTTKIYLTKNRRSYRKQTTKRLRPVGLKRIPKGSYEKYTSSKKPIYERKYKEKAFNKKSFGKPMKPIRKGLTKNRRSYRKKAVDDMDDLIRLKNIFR